MYIVKQALRTMYHNYALSFESGESGLTKRENKIRIRI